MSDWAIRAKGLGKAYWLYERPTDRLRELLSPSRAKFHKEVWALRDLDLEIKPGTVTGLIGVNGAGKSTLLKLMAGKLAPTTGNIEAGGRISSILELGTGFQKHLTGRQNALVNALFLGQRPWEAEDRLDDILAFAELGQYGDQPLSTYSSGMQARLAFAVLTTLDPEILILDEALATGDAGFAEKCKAFLRGLCRSGCTTIVASHDFVFVAETCDRVIWIDHGQLRDDGKPVEVVRSYLENLGRAQADLTPRPQNALLRFDAEDLAAQHSFLVHALQWIGPDGEILAEHYVGDDRTFAGCLLAAAHMGFPLGSARGGWGPAQDFSGVERGWGACRVCRPDLGPGGSAYLAIPIPPPPGPLPVRLGLVVRQKNEATTGTLSMQVSGTFRKIGQFRDAADPWRRVDCDVSFAFREEGTPAPPHEAAPVRGVVPGVRPSAAS